MTCSNTKCTSCIRALDHLPCDPAEGAPKIHYNRKLNQKLRTPTESNDLLIRYCGRTKHVTRSGNNGLSFIVCGKFV